MVINPIGCQFGIIVICEQRRVILMQKNRMSKIACIALAGVLAASFGTIVKLTTTPTVAMAAAPGGQTGGKMISGNMTGTNTTNGMMHVQICSSTYPCANSTNTKASK
ncbi:MAG TPA: hypothetical protein VFI73_03390 [Candidatus Nitrosopolaris sp.]|nr:hypothetical protein [Candidatus Nitrosopolaris sp.]